ncbi:MAG: VOC family protein [Ilumatobacteraceae bacterium]
MTLDDGRIGHSEFAIGEARFYLGSEFPEAGVLSPATLGGSVVTLHLQVAAVDSVFERAVGAGATAQVAPADQPHGSRHGAIVDPFGHRWLLSSPLASQQVLPSNEVSYRGIWAAVMAEDALAMIRFAVDVLGFEEYLVVSHDGDPSHVAHSELRWPEGGVVQVGSVHHGGVTRELPAGSTSIYAITRDPAAVYERCVAAGVEVVVPPHQPDYDGGGMGFTVRDAEGNLWSFGTYAG